MISSLRPLITESPLASRKKDKGKQAPTVDNEVQIPALEVKAHYQTIVGTAYQNTPISSPQKYTSRGQSPITPVKDDPESLAKASARPTVDPHLHSHHLELLNKSGLPVKKGVVTIAASVASLSRELELNPSILDFVEQVIRPINISALAMDSGSPEPEEEREKEAKEEESQATAQQVEPRPLSFPVDVCINFQIHPSRVVLTCNPHARVRCLIEIPKFSSVVSFSLFSHKQYQSVVGSQGPVLPSPVKSEGKETETGTSSHDDTITLNNINITVCLKTFALVMYTPHIPTSPSRLSSLSKQGDKEVFNLVLGQAYIHFSRKQVFIQTTAPQCKSVDDYVIQEKLRVSGIL